MEWIRGHVLGRGSSAAVSAASSTTGDVFAVNVKIADFGCAKWVSENVPFSGTPMFMAPEVARGEEQGFAADIWALGCVLIEIATGGSPWTNVTDPVSILYKIAYSDE
nr:mitogen-activated protein kinase kinase kinase 18-like [Tanacetum cinerariifolium]